MENACLVAAPLTADEARDSRSCSGGACRCVCLRWGADPWSVGGRTSKYNACDPKFACFRHSSPRFPAAVDVAPFIGCVCIRDRPAFFLWRRVITTKNCLRPERLPTQVHASFYESVVSSVWVRLDSADPKGPYVPYRLEVHSGARLLGACLLPAVAT